LIDRKIVIVGFLIAILAIVLAYVILARPSPSMVLSVDPPAIQGAIGDNIAINVSISNVADLYDWQLKLKWDPTLLNVIGITEGSLLRGKSSTFFNYQENGTEGYIVARCTLIGNMSGVSGQGTLMTVQFNVRENGTCDLNLLNIELRNSSEGLISYTIHDGHFSS
jgi:hypothetical protein